MKKLIFGAISNILIYVYTRPGLERFTNHSDDLRYPMNSPLMIMVDLPTFQKRKEKIRSLYPSTPFSEWIVSTISFLLTKATLTICRGV